MFSIRNRQCPRVYQADVSTLHRLLTMSIQCFQEPRIWGPLNLKATIHKRKKARKRKIISNDMECQKMQSKKRKSEMMEEQGSEAGYSDCHSTSMRVGAPAESPYKVVDLSASCSYDSAALPSDRWEVDSSISLEYSSTDSGRTSPCVGIDHSVLVALDCEMVGTGPNGQCSELARCSLLNYSGTVIYDKYVLPTKPVTNYRTRWSGIKKEHLAKALPFKEARREILCILKGKVIIGHALHNDFRALRITIPRSMTRDTSYMSLLRRMCYVSEKEISLKKLASGLLNRSIQTSHAGHCSVEDARAALDLYKLVEEEWEKCLQETGLYSFSELPTSLDCYMQDQYWPEDLTDCNP